MKKSARTTGPLKEMGKNSHERARIHSPQQWTMSCHKLIQPVMRVSVIIPFFNRSHTIERCLISVQKQTLGDFECLIIDDGSDTNEALALQSS